MIIRKTLLLFGVWVLLFPHAFASMPRVGSAAPELRFDTALQKPESTKLDLKSLHGKTVVLEFWATWCAPCVERIGELNRLASSVPASKVVFIAVDDEDVATVRRFSERRKMNSILAIDTAGRTFRTYGVESRPATVVIDGAGRIAAISSPDKLTASFLLKLAEPGPRTLSTSNRRETTDSKEPVHRDDSKVVAETIRQDALLEVSVKPGKAGPNDTFSYTHDSKGNFSYLGISAKTAILLAYGVPTRRVEFVDGPPTGAFDVVVRAGLLSPDTRALVLRATIPAAFGMEVEQASHKEQVLMLRVVRPELLQPTASEATPASCSIRNHRLVLINCTLENIANALEAQFQVTVLSAAETRGHYDADIPLSNEKEASTINSALADIGMEVRLEDSSFTTFQVRRVGQGSTAIQHSSSASDKR